MKLLPLHTHDIHSSQPPVPSLGDGDGEGNGYGFDGPFGLFIRVGDGAGLGPGRGFGSPRSGEGHGGYVGAYGPRIQEETHVLYATKKP